MRLKYVLTGIAAAVLVIAALIWLLLSPGWAIAAVQQRAALGLGRDLEVSGGAHLEFSPQLAIRLDGVTLANPADTDNPLLTAKALRVPLSFAQVFGHSLDVSRIILDEPALAFVVNDRGEASWDMKLAGALAVEINKGSLRYFDARNSQGFSIADANLVAEISATGEVTLSGAANVNGRLARLEAYLKALQRLDQDGTPADITVEAPDLSLTFNGRLATAKVLSLDGTVALTSGNGLAAAKWAGISLDVPEFGAIAVSGSLEVAGRAIAVHQAEVRLDSLAAKGNAVLDFRNDVPKLQAQLQAASADLAAFIPASGATPGAWGTASLNFAALKSFDADVSLAVQSLTYGGLVAGPARLSASITGGRLDAAIDMDAVAGGRAKLSLAADATALPPGFALGFRGEGVDAAKLFPALTGVSFLSGQGNVMASLSGSGRSQQEIIGTLRGSAEMALSGGALAGLAISDSIGVVSQRILDGWPSGPAARTDFDTLSAKLTLADGIATIKSFNLDSAELAMIGTGDIDLLRHAVDLRMDPRLKSGIDAAGLPVAIAVSGPWDAPRLYPDVPDILTRPEQGFAALRAMTR